MDELVVESVEQQLRLTRCEKYKPPKYFIYCYYTIKFKGYFTVTVPGHARDRVRVRVWLDYADEEFRKYIGCCWPVEGSTGYYTLDNLYNDKPKTFTYNFEVAVSKNISSYKMVDGAIFCLPFEVFVSGYTHAKTWIRIYYKFENCKVELYKIEGLPCPQMLQCKLIKDMVYIKFKINKSGYYKIMANDILISREYFSKGIHEKYFSKNMFPTGKVKIRIEKD